MQSLVRLNVKCPHARGRVALRLNLSAPLPSSRQTAMRSSCRHRQRTTVTYAVGRTAFSYETNRLLKCLLTRQAVKTTLNYLSETNGELHYFLHNYISAHPLIMDGSLDPDNWLVELAAAPWQMVQDPRRSSVVSPASAAAALQGEREVSPREVAERIMRLREHIAQEMIEDLNRISHDNTGVLKRTLNKTFMQITE